MIQLDMSCTRRKMRLRANLLLQRTTMICTKYAWRVKVSYERTQHCIVQETHPERQMFLRARFSYIQNLVMHTIPSICNNPHIFKKQCNYKPMYRPVKFGVIWKSCLCTHILYNELNTTPSMISRCLSSIRVQTHV